MSETKSQVENELQIRELVENWTKAVRAENISEVLKNHDDNIVMFDVPPPLQSKEIEAYSKTWETYFSWSQKTGVFYLNELEITAGSDVAFCHGIINCAGKKNNGEKEEYQVRLTMCFQKINGQWLIKHEHHSLPNK